MQSSSETSYFWTQAAAGELYARRCLVCGRSFMYPRIACPFCHAESLGWQRLPERSVVLTHSTVHRLPRPDWHVPVPYVVAVVGWKEYDVKLACRLVDAADDVDLCDTSVIFLPSNVGDGLRFTCERPGERR